MCHSQRDNKTELHRQKPTNTSIVCRPPKPQDATNAANLSRVPKVSHDNTPYKNATDAWTHKMPGPMVPSSENSTFDEVRLLVVSRDTDMRCVSQSWLHSRLHSKEIAIPRYTLFRKDRKGREGRVAITPHRLLTQNLQGGLWLRHGPSNSIHR